MLIHGCNWIIGSSLWIAGYLAFKAVTSQDTEWLFKDRYLGSEDGVCDDMKDTSK